MTIICAVTITYLHEYESIIACLVIWLTLELGYQTYTSILNGVLSSKTLIHLRRMAAAAGRLNERKQQIKRLTTMLAIISASTIVYVVFVGLVNQSVYYPWYLGSTFIVYNMLLNIISFILTISMFNNITKDMDQKRKSHSSSETKQTSVSVSKQM
jgi:uncharacterized membrane protein